MSDAKYKKWAESILTDAKMVEGAVHVGIGAGMGKFLALSQKLYGSFGIGLEPAPPAVCNAWRI